jgi:GntR family transcriptional regulator of vanillate catabolism
MGPDSHAIAEAPSQIERVAATLREKLLRGEFRPGKRLAELTLAPQLNVSRTPVRLALERLAHQGLVEALPFGGFRAREFTVAEIWDAIELRGVLEGTAARLAAERLEDPADLCALRECHEGFAEGPMEIDDFLDYIARNRAFHRELWRLAKSPTLQRALESVCALPFAEPGAMVFGGSNGAQAFHSRQAMIAIEHHRSILEAIASREGTRAEGIAREHARLSRRNFDWVMENRQILRKLPGGRMIAVPGEVKAKPKTRRRAG